MAFCFCPSLESPQRHSWRKEVCPFLTLYAVASRAGVQSARGFTWALGRSSSQSWVLLGSGAALSSDSVVDIALGTGAEEYVAQNHYPLLSRRALAASISHTVVTGNPNPKPSPVTVWSGPAVVKGQNGTHGCRGWWPQGSALLSSRHLGSFQSLYWNDLRSLINQQPGG